VLICFENPGNKNMYYRQTPGAKLMGLSGPTTTAGHSCYRWPLVPRG
jgi:hypothetical protein